MFWPITESSCISDSVSPHSHMNGIHTDGANYILYCKNSLMYFKMCACILKWQLLINSGKEECIQIADTKLTNYSNCVHLWLDLGSLTVNLVMGVS